MIQALQHAYGPFDLVIASHVMEHLIDFESLRLFNNLMVENGLLYIEVPDPLHYEKYQRREFLYYFDRLHVNHFTPQALTRLCAKCGFAPVKHYHYSFPYRDGGEYPALGVLLKKAEANIDVISPNLSHAISRYIQQEKCRAEKIMDQLGSSEGILIWGTGDNFFRSFQNDGPLSRLRNFVLLDRRSQEIMVGNQKYLTLEPTVGLQKFDWPVVVTISEGRQAISQQIREIDPERSVFFV
jgi:Methyltransferase domain